MEEDLVMTPVPNPDFSRVIELVKNHVNTVCKAPRTGEGPGDDDEHFIFEEAMKAVYGDKVFDSLNPIYETF